MSEEKLTLQETLMLDPSPLWAKVKECTSRALQCGALQSIATEYEFVEQEGIRFLVRILSNLARKDEDKKKQDKKTAASGKDFNPFLPYEEDLFVADLSPTHVCILNKFNVVDYHLLAITRAFEEQESLLTLQDFEALRAILAEIDGLAFYNSGKLAGASQRHKHLQVVPLPLAPDGEKIPIESAIAAASKDDSIGTIPAFSFAHAFARLDVLNATATLDCYYNLLGAVNLLSDSNPAGAYNLLATRDWMLIVPRSEEYFQSISINSLGFAGALLARDEQQMKVVKEIGPLTILKNVAQSR